MKQKYKPENDHKIIEKLYKGWFLNKQELKRAKEIVNILQFELDRRK